MLPSLCVARLLSSLDERLDSTFLELEIIAAFSNLMITTGRVFLLKMFKKKNIPKILEQEILFNQKKKEITKKKHFCPSNINSRIKTCIKQKKSYYESKTYVDKVCARGAIMRGPPLPPVTGITSCGDIIT